MIPTLRILGAMTIFSLAWPPRLYAQVGADIARNTAPTIRPSDWAGAIRSGEPRRWTAVLEAMGHASALPEAALNSVAGLLRDTAADVRLRAVLALGAAGPKAAATAPALASLLDDPDTWLRMETAFALGAVNGLRDPNVLRAVFRTAVRDTSRRVLNFLHQSLNQLAGGPISIGDAFSREIRDALASGQPTATRLWALKVASHTAVSWTATEFPALLRDADPGVRYATMYALAALRPPLPGARAVIERLQFDSVKRVRDGVPRALGVLATGPASLCSHRGTPGPTPLHVAVDTSFASLRGDGRGPYQHGTEQVRTLRSSAFNLFLSWADGGSLAPISVDTTRPVVSRALVFDFSKPVLSSGAHALGVVRDSAAVLHFFWMWDPGRRVVWTFDDLPVGGRGSSDRVQFDLSIAGRAYMLQFGPWVLGDCKEPYAFGARLGGDGTTRVQIERLAQDEYRIWAPAGSAARLWDYGDPQRPRDLGLYLFSFGLRLAGAR